MIRAAHIGYMSDQNEPSKPQLADLDEGSIGEQLLALWSGLSEDEDGNPAPGDAAILRAEEDWGDVCVSDGDVALFVTFHDDDRMTALAELGMA